MNTNTTDVPDNRSSDFIKNSYEAVYRVLLLAGLGWIGFSLHQTTQNGIGLNGRVDTRTAIYGIVDTRTNINSGFITADVSGNVDTRVSGYVGIDGYVGVNGSVGVSGSVDADVSGSVDASVSGSVATY